MSLITRIQDIRPSKPSTMATLPAVSDHERLAAGLYEPIGGHGIKPITWVAAVTLCVAFWSFLLRLVF
jgi:hypothetical protein